MNSDFITLISETEKRNDLGEKILTKNKRGIFAKLDKLSFQNAVEGQSKGFKPQLKFILTDYYDYEGESELEFEGRLYQIGFVNRLGQGLEIICGAGVDVENG